MEQRAKRRSAEVAEASGGNVGIGNWRGQPAKIAFVGFGYAGSDGFDVTPFGQVRQPQAQAEQSEPGSKAAGPWKHKRPDNRSGLSKQGVENKKNGDKVPVLPFPPSHHYGGHGRQANIGHPPLHPPEPAPARPALTSAGVSMFIAVSYLATRGLPCSPIGAS